MKIAEFILGNHFWAPDLIAGWNSHDWIGLPARLGAPVENFFNSQKNERNHGSRYATRVEARQDIFEYVEVFYNRSRRHSALGYDSPAQHYATWQSEQKLAA